MRNRDAEVVVAAGALLHDVGLSIHRSDHETYSLFLAERKLRDLLADVYEEPQRTVVVSEALHAIIGHRRRGVPYTLEAGVVRVADALDMAQGRSRIPFEAGRIGIHSLSAAAVDEVDISAGTDRPIRLEIKLNNSAGIFQVDDLLATKIRGTLLEPHVEVVAEVEGETEKRLLTAFRLPEGLGARASPPRPSPAANRAAADPDRDRLAAELTRKASSRWSVLVSPSPRARPGGPTASSPGKTASPSASSRERSRSKDDQAGRGPIAGPPRLRRCGR